MSNQAKIGDIDVSGFIKTIVVNQLTNIIEHPSLLEGGVTEHLGSPVADVQIHGFISGDDRIQQVRGLSGQVVQLQFLQPSNISVFFLRGPCYVNKVDSFYTAGRGYAFYEWIFYGKGLGVFASGGGIFPQRSGMDYGLQSGFAWSRDVPIFTQAYAANNRDNPLFSEAYAANNRDTPLFTQSYTGSNRDTPLFTQSYAANNRDTPLFTQAYGNNNSRELNLMVLIQFTAISGGG